MQIVEMWYDLSLKHLGRNITILSIGMMSFILCSRWKLDPQESRRSMVKLRSAAETCKHVLSTVSTAHCFVESLCEGVDFSYNITRARFENLITSYLSEYLQPVHEVLEKAGLSSKIIAKVGA